MTLINHFPVHSSSPCSVMLHYLMPRLYMQVWQPGNEQKAHKKVLSCCQARAKFSLWSGYNACFILQARNSSFKTWKAVFTNVRFHSWSSKPLSV